MVESGKVAEINEPRSAKKARTMTWPLLLLPLISILFTFFLFEAAIRIAIRQEVAYFRNPFLYSYPFADDFWKLDYRWRDRTDDGQTSENLNPDPFLGWSPRKSPQNPLGLIGHEPYTPDVNGRNILFYGDSFVAGKTAVPADNIPRQLDALLPDAHVYNYGVSNYAVDQIYLRFKETHATFATPTVVIGIFTLDMDRSLLTVRNGAPKPHFTVGADDTLVLHGIQGIPINTTAADWVTAWNNQNPPALRSYAWAFVRQKIDNLRTGGDWLTATSIQDELEQLNGLIITEMVREARAHDLPLLFVLFYTREELATTYWRESFLIEQLEELGVPYVDTKEVLLRAAQAESTDVATFYFADGGHTNAVGNGIVAAAIAESLRLEIGD